MSSGSSDGAGLLAIIGLVAVGVVVLVIVLKLLAAITTTFFVPILFIAIGVAIGVWFVSRRR